MRDRPGLLAGGLRTWFSLSRSNCRYSTGLARPKGSQPTSPGSVPARQRRRGGGRGVSTCLGRGRSAGCILPGRPPHRRPQRSQAPLPRDMRRPRLAGGGGGASIGHGALRGVGACGGVPPARAPPQRAALAAACVRFGRRALRGSCGGRARTIEPGGRHGAREPRRAVDRGPTLGGLALLGGDLRARGRRCQPLRPRAAGSRARQEPPPRAPCAAPSWCRTGRHPSWRPSWWRPG